MNRNKLLKARKGLKCFVNGMGNARIEKVNADGSFIAKALSYDRVETLSFLFPLRPM